MWDSEGNESSSTWRRLRISRWQWRPIMPPAFVGLPAASHERPPSKAGVASMVTTSCRKSSSVQSSSTESRSSDRKLKPLPPDPFRHQNSAIARQCKLWESKNQRDYHRSKFHGRFSFIVAISNDERRDLFPGNLQFQMAQSCRLVLRSGLKKPWCLQ
jgi:hypothetical protein